MTATITGGHLQGYKMRMWPLCLAEATVEIWYIDAVRPRAWRYFNWSNESFYELEVKDTTVSYLLTCYPDGIGIDTLRYGVGSCYVKVA